MRLAIEESLGRHQDSGCAVAALRRAEIGKTFLEGMKLAFRGEPLHRRDGPPVAFGGEQQAREERLAIHEHGARAALAELAAVFRAGEAEVLAQHFEQRLVAVGKHVGRLAVHRERQADLHGWTPRTRYREITSPTAAALPGPSGR